MLRLDLTDHRVRKLAPYLNTLLHRTGEKRTGLILILALLLQVIQDKMPRSMNSVGL